MAFSTVKSLGYRIWDWVWRYRGPFVISLLASVVAGVAGYFVGILFDAGDPLQKTIVVSNATLVALLILLLFYLKRLYHDRIRHVNNLLNDLFGYTWHNSQYFQRKRHFAVEKDVLARAFVHALPGILTNILREGKPDRVNIVLDSGTTITPIFKYLPFSEVRTGFNAKLAILTNNIAGIEELHRVDPRRWSFAETDFFLIGGYPLGKYRATTGGEGRPPLFLSEMLSNDETSEQVVNVGVVTANWILGGRNLDTISLCARGRGHFEFKQAVIDLCQYIVILAPLPKILRLNDAHALNALLPKGEDTYRQIVIPETRRDTTRLLTTFRSGAVDSPLNQHSDNLRRQQQDKVETNFEYLDPIPVFDPTGVKARLRITELPHSYLRSAPKFSKAYGYNIP